MQSSTRKPTRDKQINIRATDEEHAVIDYAASLVNKNRTDFITEKAVHEAQNIILDQSFIEQLEAPVQNVDGRQRLMDVKPKWK